MGFFSAFGHAYAKQAKKDFAKEKAKWDKKGNTKKVKKLFEDLAKEKGIKGIKFG